MPFVTRVTDTPSLSQLTALEQIVIVDKAGPSIQLGVAPGAAVLVAEFLKGPFVPYEIVSSGDLTATFGGLSAVLSQSAAGLQDGSGARFEGNGRAELLGKSFNRLVLQRVDADMTTVDGGATKAFVQFTVYVAAADEDPINLGTTGREILIPAGTRFGNTTLVSTSTGVVCLSQDMVIPKGTTINTTTPPTGFQGRIVVTPSFLNGNGTTGATAFFSKGTTQTSGALVAAIDTVLANTASVVGMLSGDFPSAVTAAAAATAIFAAGTAAATLAVKYESLYSAAMDKTLPIDEPAEHATVIWAARRGETAATIRTPLENHAVAASGEGRGRICVVSGPRVGTATGDAATASAAKTAFITTTPAESPGRLDRKIVTAPYVFVYAQTLGRNILVSPAGFMASTLNLFPEEKNPGARNPYIQNIQGFEDAFVASPLVRQDYVNFKANGVCALRRDKAVGWQFQSGITSVSPAVDQSLAPIKRRRMADFIQDTLAGIGSNYNKEPATQDRVDMLVGDIESFLLTLKSPPNPATQRIKDYLVDAVSGNTDILVGLGIYTVIVKVQLLASLDTLVFQTTIGETVDVDL